MIYSSCLQIVWPTASLRVLLLLLLTATASFAQTRVPVPPAEKQKDLLKLLEDGYDLPRLDSTAKKQEALARLMESSADENLGADERHVVLTTAITLASQTGDAELWRTAVDALVLSFDVDVTKEKTRLLMEFLKASKPNARVKPIVEEALELAHAAAKERQFPEAISLLSSVDIVLRRAADGTALKPLITEARTAITAREKEWKLYQAAASKLEANVDDPAANLVVGRWHLIQDADWTKSLPFLAKASDAKWQAAAKLELANPTESIAQIAVGDAWWDIAQKEAATIKVALLMHAGQWYELGEAKLTSTLKKQVVAKRLDEIAALRIGTSTSGPTLTSAQTTEKPGEWIDLLKWSEGADWTQRGIDWNKFVEGKPRADSITLKSDFAARYPLSAMIDGSYEFETEFTRHDGDNSIGVFFPIGLHTMHLFVQTGGGLAGVGSIDGKWLRDNVTTRKVNVIENGVRHHFRIKVKNEGGSTAFQVDFDGTKDFMKWEGKSRSLIMGAGGDFPISMTRRMWLISHYGRVTFHKAQIRMLSGTVQRDFADDRDQNDGVIRLADEKMIDPKVHLGLVASRQLPLDIEKFCSVAVDTKWPLIKQEFQFCQHFYGAMPPSRLTCPIPNGSKSFSVVAVNEASRISKFAILIDGKEVLDSGASDLQVMKVDIPGRSTVLELIVDPAGDPEWDHTYWCYPRFHSVPSAKISEKMLDGRPGPLPFKIGASSVGSMSLTHNEPLEGLKTPPISFRDAVPCDEFIFAHAPSSISFKVPEGTKRFTAIGYNLSSQSTKFEVWTDGKQIYQSPQAGIVQVDVKVPTGAKLIELKINDLGNVAGDHSMWCYPRLHRK